MNRIFAALILSTAAVGAAQAGEIGYLDNPGNDVHSSVTRAQVQRDLDVNRAHVSAFQGQLDPTLTQARAGGVATRAEVAQQQHANVTSPAGAAFVNG
jgi:hypothetical protein